MPESTESDALLENWLRDQLTDRLRHRLWTEAPAPALEGGHDQVPNDPADGQRFTCSCCGAAFEFVVLDDGRPGEWVGLSTSPRERTLSDGEATQ